MNKAFPQHNPGYYIKTTTNEGAEIQIPTTADVFCQCPGCGKEHQVNLVELAQEFPGFCVHDGLVHCEQCSGKQETADEKLTARDILDILFDSINDQEIGLFVAAERRLPNKLNVWTDAEGFTLTVEELEDTVTHG